MKSAKEKMRKLMLWTGEEWIILENIPLNEIDNVYEQLTASMLYGYD